MKQQAFELLSPGIEPAPTGKGSSLGHYVQKHLQAHRQDLGSLFAAAATHPLNVKAHGAIGDGVNDETAAIAAADAEAFVTGRAVLIPAGTFLVTSNLEISSPLIIAPGGVIKVGNSPELIAGWSNNPEGADPNWDYETFASSGNAISSAINSSVAGKAGTNAIAFDSAKTYRVTTNVTKVSGEMPVNRIAGTAMATAATDIGILYELMGDEEMVVSPIAGQTRLWLYNNSTNGSWSATTSCKEIVTLEILGAFTFSTRMQCFDCSDGGKVVFGQEVNTSASGISSVFPEWFGAARDHSTDCWFAFQRALESRVMDNAATSERFNSGTVSLASGQYACKSTIKIVGRHTNLEGQGWSTRILSTMGTHGILITAEPSTATGRAYGLQSRVSNLMMIGTTPAGQKAQGLITTRGGFFDALWITTYGEHGLYIAGPLNDATAVDSADEYVGDEVYDENRGIGTPSFGGGNYWTAQNCYLTSNAKDGLHAVSGDNNVGFVSHVYSGSNGRYAFYDRTGIQTTYINPGAEDNGTGAYRFLGAANRRLIIGGSLSDDQVHPNDDNFNTANTVLLHPVTGMDADANSVDPSFFYPISPGKTGVPKLRNHSYDGVTYIGSNFGSASDSDNDVLMCEKEDSGGSPSGNSKLSLTYLATNGGQWSWRTENSNQVLIMYPHDNTVSPNMIGIPLGTVIGTSTTVLLEGTGSPEGAQTASPGSMYLNRSGGANTSLYVKESGTGNTGWVAK